METNDNIIDFKEWTVPTRWEDITLKQFQELEKYYADKDKEFDVRDVLHILCNKTVDEVNALPIEFSEKIMNTLTFLSTRPEEKKPTNKIIVGGITYWIHTERQLKTGEYIAVNSALKSDKYNYAAILGILARKEDEAYDSKFENEILPDRIQMFENIPMTDAMPTVAFFLNLYIMLWSPSQLSSEVKEGISHMRKDIEILQQNGEISKRCMKSAMKKLKKLEKSINYI